MIQGQYEIDISNGYIFYVLPKKLVCKMARTERLIQAAPGALAKTTGFQEVSVGCGYFCSHCSFVRRWAGGAQEVCDLCIKLCIRNECMTPLVIQ